jgi:hypothetical protein
MRRFGGRPFETSGGRSRWSCLIFPSLPREVICPLVGSQERRFGDKRARYLPILYVRSPAAFFEEAIFSPPLLPSTLTKPRTVCFCHPVASTISANVTPFARFIIAITSAFLLVRASVAPFCARARREVLAGDFFDWVLSAPTGVADGASSGDRRWMASHIRVIPIWRLVNFLTGFRLSKGATPAKLFQMSTRRDVGHYAVSLASSFAVENDCDSPATVGGPVCATMLFSESIVNVGMILLCRGSVAVHTSITPVGPKGKRNQSNSGQNLGRVRKCALELPGRACR